MNVKKIVSWAIVIFIAYCRFAQLTGTASAMAGSLPSAQ